MLVSVSIWFSSSSAVGLRPEIVGLDLAFQLVSARSTCSKRAKGVADPRVVQPGPAP